MKNTTATVICYKQRLINLDPLLKVESDSLRSSESATVSIWICSQYLTQTINHYTLNQRTTREGPEVRVTERDERLCIDRL